MKLKNPIKDMRTIKALLLGAEDQARAAGESQPGAEHLLLSALELPEGSGRRAFERAGADPDELRPAIERQHADALRAIGIESPIDDTHAADRPEGERGEGVYRSKAPLQSAFQAAGELARDQGTSLRGAHVVIAVADMEHGTAARALRTMGVDREALAVAAREELAPR